MATLGEFLSPQAGQERRKWLNETLGQFIPPELRGWVGAASELNPVTNMERASLGAKRVADPSLPGWERMAAAGDTAVNMGAVLAPVAGAKMAGTAGVDGANAIVEALTAASPMRGALQDFAADEFGGVGFRAFHGSPHDFDRFSLDKIGTGEGAQAYGHGLYFAEAEDVAKRYRDTLAPAATQSAKVLTSADGDLTRAIEAARAEVARFEAMPPQVYRNMYLSRAQAALADLEGRAAGNAPNTGRIYEVQINADPNDFLDWDKPLSEQPAAVREALGPRVDALRQAGAGIPQDPIGEALWRVAHPQGGVDKTNFSIGPAAQATERLREAGIPGIRYLDAGSRGAGDGSRNYVVFDDKLIEILRKYGLAGAVPMGALLGQSQDPMGSYLEAQ